MDFFRWGNIKQHTYIVPPRIIVDLVARIQVTIIAVDGDMLKCVRECTVQHNAVCLEIDGGRFEQQL
jgi:hypothetical protein